MRQFASGAVQADGAHFQHVAVVGHFQRGARDLYHQQDRHAGIAQRLYVAQNFLHNQGGQATGNGIMLALATLFPDAGIDIAALGGRQAMGARSLDDAAKQDPAKAFTPVAPGSYNSAAIIMLTDGQRTTGVDPLEAAQWAADRGVRVYTVGVGTVQGETIGFEGWSMRVRLDEETLKAVALRTQAEYFHAATAADLKKVYETLSSRLTVEKRETEISALLALVGAALAVLAAGLSVGWFGRVM